MTTFTDLGFEVVHGHIDTGQDFFAYSEPQGDIVVSNPPFSKRTKILKRLYEFDIPFAIVLGLNGLFDSKERRDALKNGVELLVPQGRMKFLHRDLGVLGQPPFQCVYVCHNVLEEKIVFSDAKF